MLPSVLSEKSAANLWAGPVAAVPHGRARPPGRCTAAGALRAPTGRMRAGAGTPSGATRLLSILNALPVQDTRKGSCYMMQIIFKGLADAVESDVAR